MVGGTVPDWWGQAYQRGGDLVKPVLFATGLGKDLNRAENIRVLYDAYDGEKAFVSTHDPGVENLVGSGRSAS